MKKNGFRSLPGFGVFPFDDINIVFQYFNHVHYNIILLSSVLRRVHCP